MFVEWIGHTESIAVVLGGKTFHVPRARLGLHMRLYHIQQQYEEAVDQRNAARVYSLLVEYLTVACGLPLGSPSLHEMAVAFEMVKALNAFRADIACLRFPGQAVDGKPPPYEYADRWATTWIHSLAETYGWALGDILQLWPEQAAALLQEILISEQMEKEWEYGIHGVGVVYNKGSDKTSWRPLPKPGWMVPDIAPVAIRIPKSLLPVGLVVNVGEALKAKRDQGTGRN